MKLRFTKMHGLGNDFIVIDAINQSVELSTEQIQHLADRHFGVGCDQVLMISAPQTAEADFFYRIFNANGSEVSQCGNGVRCVARFINEQGLSQKNRLIIETKKCRLQTILDEDDLITVDMGQPVFALNNIPVQCERQQLDHVLVIHGEPWLIATLGMGNPHAVTWVKDIAQAPVAEIGAIISKHSLFPEETNVEFAQLCSKDRLKLRVFERHVGETLACGSGACAAAVAGILQHGMQHRVTVELPGGTLQIAWQGLGTSVWMKGPAEIVFAGEITL